MITSVQYDYQKDLESSLKGFYSNSFFHIYIDGGFDMDIDYEKDKRQPQPNEAASRRAVLYDEWIVTEAGKEAMNMYEFLRGIFNSKVPHFQSIFFHNCLMGGVESLLDISLFCDYIVCSSHLLSQNPAPVRQMINGARYW